MTASANIPRTAHVIRSQAEAIAVVHTLAARFAIEAGGRDRDRRLPFDEFWTYLLIDNLRLNGIHSPRSTNPTKGAV